MSAITTHILDTSSGRPAAGVAVTLAVRSGDAEWIPLGAARTNDDGRVPGLLAEDHELVAGTYALRFEVGAYFEGRNVTAFYPQVEIVFEIREPGENYHVPLLLNPFGYTTYRGS